MTAAELSDLLTRYQADEATNERVLRLDEEGGQPVAAMAALGYRPGGREVTGIP